MGERHVEKEEDKVEKEASNADFRKADVDEATAEIDEQVSDKDEVKAARKEKTAEDTLKAKKVMGRKDPAVTKLYSTGGGVSAISEHLMSAGMVTTGLFIFAFAVLS